MTRSEAMKELRELLDDNVGEPYKWATTRLTGFMEEGQDKFCEETGFFVDTDYFSITTEAGVASYPISERVIKVTAMWTSTYQLTERKQGTAGVAVPRALLTGNQQSGGPPKEYQTDFAPGTILFSPVPDGIYTINSRVQRYSSTPLSRGEFEIPFRFHRAAIYYAAAKAYDVRDRELYDPKKSAAFMKDFDGLVVEGIRYFKKLSGAENEVVPVPYYQV